MLSDSLLSALGNAVRFFARPLAFDLECPRCGEVYQVRIIDWRKKHKGRGKLTLPVYDPLTSRFTCGNPQCQRTYVIGIVAWSISGKGSATSPPEDQVPSPRQLAGLRKEGAGWWMEEKQRFGRPHTTNLTDEEDRRTPAVEEE